MGLTPALRKTGIGKAILYRCCFVALFRRVRRGCKSKAELFHPARRAILICARDLRARPDRPPVARGARSARSYDSNRPRRISYNLVDKSVTVTGRDTR